MSDIGLGLAIIADSLPAKSPMSLNSKGRSLTLGSHWRCPLSSREARPVAQRVGLTQIEAGKVRFREVVTATPFELRLAHRGGRFAVSVFGGDQPRLLQGKHLHPTRWRRSRSPIGAWSLYTAPICFAWVWRRRSSRTRRDADVVLSLDGGVPSRDLSRVKAVVKLPLVGPDACHPEQDFRVAGPQFRNGCVVRGAWCVRALRAPHS